jgi:multiple sugar transport system permease protein
VASVDPPRVRGARLSRRETLDGWLFASPWIVGFVWLTLGPMLASLALSFTDWQLLVPPTWVGFANIDRALFRDPLVWRTLAVTVTYSLVAVPLHLVLGVTISLLLNTRVRGLAFYRTIYYLPAVISGVAVALLWRWVFNPDFGILNYFLGLLGVRGPAWLADSDWALWALVLMSLWHVGGGIVIYLAGLQGIPTELYEAATVDGATWLQQTRFVTLPMLSPVLFFQLLVGLIGALQTFTQAYVMTGGGPGDSTRFYMLYLYENGFQFFKMGYASVLAWILFVFILALTLVTLRTSSLWVHYEGQARKQ